MKGLGLRVRDLVPGGGGGTRQQGSSEAVLELVGVMVGGAVLEGVAKAVLLFERVAVPERELETEGGRVLVLVAETVGVND